MGKGCPFGGVRLKAKTPDACEILDARIADCGIYMAVVRAREGSLEGDADGDGVSGVEEVFVLGTDPLLKDAGIYAPPPAAEPETKATQASKSASKPAFVQKAAARTAFMAESGGTTYYADALNGNDSDNGLSWNTAKQTIQAAVDIAQAGDTVLVAPGTYSEGSRVMAGELVPNRLVLDKAVLVRSSGGANATVIQGSGADYFDTAGAVRCVYLADGVLDGFTLQGGATLSFFSYDYTVDCAGGGLFMGFAAEGSGVCNCVIRNCIAYNGGGVKGCCGEGGNGRLENCLLVGNTASYGGAGYRSSLANCTVSGNGAWSSTGGLYYGALTNSVLTGNAGWEALNFLACEVSHSCADPLPEGDGNINADPLFSDAANGDFTLQALSPCLDAGDDASVSQGTDLAGTFRIQGNAVDMGAYERNCTVYELSVCGGTGGCMLPWGVTTEVAAETPDGYVFSGWSVSPDWADLGPGFDALQCQCAVRMPDCDVTLTALFTAMDSDGDGVPDLQDAFPDDAAAWTDTDADGMPDELHRELNQFTTLVEDEDDDNDGMPDCLEAAHPCLNSKYPDAYDDADGDGVLNIYELENGTDPCDTDPDGDGLSNAEELAAGTNIFSADSDGDGFSDGPLIPAGSESIIGICDAFPLDPAGTVDTDGDGMPDYLTGMSSTSVPQLEEDLDDDNDSMPDWWETLNGYCPTNREDSDTLCGVMPVWQHCYYELTGYPDTGWATLTFTVCDQANVNPRTTLFVNGYAIPLAGRADFSLRFPVGDDISLGLSDIEWPGMLMVYSDRCIVTDADSGGYVLIGGGSTTVRVPEISLNTGAGNVFCIHGDGKQLTAVVSGGLEGDFFWYVNGNFMGNGQTLSPEVLSEWDYVTVDFYPYGGNGVPVTAWAVINRCHMVFCEHGKRLGECELCLRGGCVTCDIHAPESKCQCPCLTIEGGDDRVCYRKDYGTGFILGDHGDTCGTHGGVSLSGRCCQCPEHRYMVQGLGEKLYMVKSISPEISVWLSGMFPPLPEDPGGMEVFEGDVFALSEGVVLHAWGEVPSVRFNDAECKCCQFYNPEVTKSATFTVFHIGIETEPGSGMGGDSCFFGENCCLIPAKGVCDFPVKIVTESCLEEGSLVLSASDGLMFSESQGTAAGGALSSQNKSPPNSVAWNRQIYIGASKGGLHTLEYQLLQHKDGGGDRVWGNSTLFVNAVLPQLAESEYYVALGMTTQLTVSTGPDSYDPGGYDLLVDGIQVSDPDFVYPPWYIDVSWLEEGQHVLTLRSKTFPTLTDEAMVTVIDVTMGPSTVNFSPQLGETATLNVMINPPPPDGGFTGLSFKMEIVRETANGGEQHVGWVNVDTDSTPESRPVSFASMAFDWNGLSSATLQQANGRDEFQGFWTTSVRVFPAVTAGQPVPPPFVTAVAKIVSDIDGTVMCEARKRIFVPQVVKMMYDTASVDAIIAGYFTETGGNAMIQPIPANQWPTYRAQIAARAQAYFSAENVNLRFVDSTVSVSQPYTVMQMNGVDDNWVTLGEAPCDMMNVLPNQTGNLYYLSFKRSMVSAFSAPGDDPSPVTPDETVSLWAHVAAHETGHTLGLVAYGFLDGDYPETCHNAEPYSKDVLNVMDNGELRNIFQKMGRVGSGWSFRALNAGYLRFILPKQ